MPIDVSEDERRQRHPSSSSSKPSAPSVTEESNASSTFDTESFVVRRKLCPPAGEEDSVRTPNSGSRSRMDCDGKSTSSSRMSGASRDKLGGSFKSRSTRSSRDTPVASGSNNNNNNNNDRGGRRGDERSDYDYDDEDGEEYDDASLAELTSYGSTHGDVHPHHKGGRNGGGGGDRGNHRHRRGGGKERSSDVEEADDDARRHRGGGHRGSGGGGRRRKPTMSETEESSVDHNRRHRNRRSRSAKRHNARSGSGGMMGSLGSTLSSFGGACQGINLRTVLLCMMGMSFIVRMHHHYHPPPSSMETMVTQPGPSLIRDLVEVDSGPGVRGAAVVDEEADDDDGNAEEQGGGVEGEEGGSEVNNLAAGEDDMALNPPPPPAEEQQQQEEQPQEQEQEQEQAAAYQQAPLDQQQQQQQQPGYPQPMQQQQPGMVQQFDPSQQQQAFQQQQSGFFPQQQQGFVPQQQQGFAPQQQQFQQQPGYPQQQFQQQFQQPGAYAPAGGQQQFMQQPMQQPMQQQQPQVQVVANQGFDPNTPQVAVASDGSAQQMTPLEWQQQQQQQQLPQVQAQAAVDPSQQQQQLPPPVPQEGQVQAAAMDPASQQEMPQPQEMAQQAPPEGAAPAPPQEPAAPATGEPQESVLGLLSNFKDTWDPYDKTDIPMFWHIPKAGGSSIKDSMGGCHRFVQATEFGVTDGHDTDTEVAIVFPAVPGVADTDRSPFVNIDSTTVAGIQRAKSMGFADANLAQLVVSPFVFETNDLFTPTAKGRLFSVFRHPIERAVSMFYYIRVADWEPSYKPELKDWTLEQYATSDIVENNWMTRQLSNQLGGELTDENLNKAMEVVRTKFLVGLMSQIEPTMARVEKFFRMTYHVNPPNQERCRERFMSGGANSNASNKKPVAEGDPAWELLAQQNNFDLQLYDYIEALFVEQEAFVVGLPDEFRKVDGTCCKCDPPTYPPEGFTCPVAVKNQG